jgi:DNA-binding IclR family transcriptional regulator
MVGASTTPNRSGSALLRGLEILTALDTDEARTQGGLGVVRIAARVGREKSQISRALSTLADAGYVERDPTSLRYRVGWRLVALGLRARDERLIDEGRKQIRELVVRTGETAHLSVLAGADVLTIASETPPSAIQVAGWVGRTVPAWCSSAGRALLLDHDRAALVARVGASIGRHAGPNAPRSVAELEAKLAADRSRGWALADEELEEGLVAAAAPVRDSAGSIVFAINVSGPKYRVGERIAEVGESVAQAAALLSSVHAGPPSSPPRHEGLGSPA